MPDNGRKPVIAKGQVIAVLKAMTGTSGFKRSLYNCNELLELQVVQNIVNTATFPSSTEATQFALEQIMKDIIQEHFLRLLKVFEITSPKLDCTLSEAQEHIKICARTSDGKLLGWAWMYYHFARYDLNVKTKAFCEVANIVARSLYRYEKHCVKRIEFELIGIEWNARMASILLEHT